MFVNWLRKGYGSSTALLLARLYIGWNWLQASYENFSSDFNTMEYLQEAVKNPIIIHDEVAYPLYYSFLKSFALKNTVLFDTLIPWGQLLIGIAMIIGCLTTVAGIIGMGMNLAFLLAGTISSNPMMILVTIVILIGGRNSGKLGLDRYILAYFDYWFKPPKKV